MTLSSAILILIDFLAVALLLLGFLNEDKLIDFEQNVKRIVLGNIRRIVRKTKYKVRYKLNGKRKI